MDKLVSISKASKILDVSISTLRRWDNNGSFKAIKTVGGARRYKISDLERMMNNE